MLETMDFDGLEPRDLRRITRAEYDEMARMGLFEDEKVELLRGWIVKMSPIGGQHSELVDRLNELFVLSLQRRFRVRVQRSFAASDDSEPEPDLAVYPQGDYSSAHPSEALLLIEVADSSLQRDRGIKRRLYAEIGVPEYWIVDVAMRSIEVHRAPVGGQYAEVRTVAAGSLSPERLSEVVLDVAALFARGR